jgi:hypothetical protein
MHLIFMFFLISIRRYRGQGQGRGLGVREERRERRRMRREARDKLMKTKAQGEMLPSYQDGEGDRLVEKA